MKAPRRAALGAFDPGLHLALEAGEAAQAMSAADAEALIRLLLSLPPRLAVDDALVTRLVRELSLPPGDAARVVPVRGRSRGSLACPVRACR